MPAHPPVGGLVGEGCQAGVHQRHGHLLPRPGVHSFNQGQQEPLFQLMGRHHIHHRYRHFVARSTARSVHGDKARLGLDNGIITRTMRARSIAVDSAHDEPGIDGVQNRPGQAQVPFLIG